MDDCDGGIPKKAVVAARGIARFEVAEDVDVSGGKSGLDVSSFGFIFKEVGGNKVDCGEREGGEMDGGEKEGEREGGE